jgi:hypothetical protein
MGLTLSIPAMMFSHYSHHACQAVGVLEESLLDGVDTLT